MPPGVRRGFMRCCRSIASELLEARLRRAPPLKLEEGVDIGLKLGRAIYALHRLRIIHRDVKPENVILAHDGKTARGLRLLDLGVARLPGIDASANEDIPGTPSYMAPELFAGAMGDERSDVYAFGVTLYRLFSGGHYPYGEIEAFSHPRFGKRVPLSRYRPDLPAWLDAILGAPRPSTLPSVMPTPWSLPSTWKMPWYTAPRPSCAGSRSTSVIRCVSGSGRDAAVARVAGVVGGEINSRICTKSAQTVRLSHAMGARPW